MRIQMNSLPFYQDDDPAIYQRTMTRFNDIIKYVGPNVHIFELDMVDDRNYFDADHDATLKPLSCNVVENILTACSNLNTLSIRRTRFIDIGDIGAFYPNLHTLKISRRSDWQDGFLSRISLILPTFNMSNCAPLYQKLPRPPLSIFQCYLHTSDNSNSRSTQWLITTW